MYVSWSPSIYTVTVRDIPSLFFHFSPTATWSTSTSHPLKLLQYHYNLLSLLYLSSFPCPNVVFALVASASQVLWGSDENPEFWVLTSTSVPFFLSLEETLPCSPYSLQWPFSCYFRIPRGLEAACPSLPLRVHSPFLLPTPSALGLTHFPSCSSQISTSGALPLYNLRFQPLHYCYIC